MPARMREPKTSPKPIPASATVRGFGVWVLLECAHHAEQQHRHGSGEGRVLGVHKHVTVVKRAGREQNERDQSGRRPAEAPADAPCCDQPDDADRGADQPSCLEEAERKHLGGERSRHVKAAAIFVEIDEGKCALIAKA